MIPRFRSQKIVVLMFAAILAIHGLIGIGYADQSIGGRPHFHDDTTSRSVAENVSSGTNVGSAVSAHNCGLCRYLLSGKDASSFSIDEDNGQLKTATTLDYETKTSYSVKVTLQRGTTSSFRSNTVTYLNADSITVTINVTDIDLDFSDDSTTRFIAENTAADTNIGSAVTASNFNSSLDRYVLSGTDASSFTIDSRTGQLKTKAALDYEVKNSYTVTVGAHAGAQDTAEDTITVTINVTNSTDTSCPPEYFFQNNNCWLIFPGAVFIQADALPPLSSEEAARVASLLKMDRVIFNELFNASNDTHDWIEFRNVTDTDVDLSGWRLIVVSSEATTAFNIPEGTMLPVGEVLLFVNTDPSHPDMPLASAEDTAYHCLVNKKFNLPQTPFTLILRSPTTWEDTVGNYLFGYEELSAVPLLTPDVAWARAKPNVLGARAEAWVESGYQDGLGYDDGAPEDTSLGTPGYHPQEMIGDANGDGTVNILDLVRVASQIGESGVTSADLNGDGVVNIQDLVLVANAFGGAAAAPSAHGLTATHVEQWLRLATQENAQPIQTSVSQREFSYERGIQVLEQLRQSLLPKTTLLLPNYPNPFNPETWIPYHLARASEVQITIYDARGSLVRNLSLGHRAAGHYTNRNRAAYWDGTNELNESVASGLYFYTLIAGDFTATRKMLILK